MPKGTDDIWVVWDLAKNGLNETMYTPTFFLAIMGSYLRRIEAGMYGGDFDIGEQFHNYMLHESEQRFCGVDIPPELEVSLQAEGGIQCRPAHAMGALGFWVAIVPILSFAYAGPSARTSQG